MNGKPLSIINKNEGFVNLKILNKIKKKETTIINTAVLTA
jgi:hypothetical protein